MFALNSFGLVSLHASLLADTADSNPHPSVQNLWYQRLKQPLSEHSVLVPTEYICILTSGGQSHATNPSGINFLAHVAPHLQRSDSSISVPWFNFYFFKYTDSVLAGVDLIAFGLTGLRWASFFNSPDHCWGATLKKPWKISRTYSPLSVILLFAAFTSRFRLVMARFA